MLTLSGTLQFETRNGEKQVVEPGDVLLAEDVTGGGHRWLTGVLEGRRGLRDLALAVRRELADG